LAVLELADFPYSPYYMLHLFHPKLPADLQCLRTTDPTTVSRFPTIGDYICDKKAMQKAVHQSVQIALQLLFLYRAACSMQNAAEGKTA
jgi:hypothetical protein